MWQEIGLLNGQKLRAWPLSRSNGDAAADPRRTSVFNRLYQIGTNWAVGKVVTLWWASPILSALVAARRAPSRHKQVRDFPTKEEPRPGSCAGVPFATLPESGLNGAARLHGNSCVSVLFPTRRKRKPRPLRTGAFKFGPPYGG